MKKTWVITSVWALKSSFVLDYPDHSACLSTGYFTIPAIRHINRNSWVKTYQGDIITLIHFRCFTSPLWITHARPCQITTSSNSPLMWIEAHDRQGRGRGGNGIIAGTERTSAAAISTQGPGTLQHRDKNEKKEILRKEIEITDADSVELARMEIRLHWLGFVFQQATWYCFYQCFFFFFLKTNTDVFYFTHFLLQKEMKKNKTEESTAKLVMLLCSL